MRCFFVLLAIGFLYTHSAAANELERLTLAYFDLLEYQEYDAIARTYDPEDLKAVRQAFAFLDDAPDGFRQPLYERMFGAWASQATVDKLTDAEFFAGFLSNSRAAVQRSRVTALRAEYLGHVNEDDETAHVVVRTIAEAGDEQYSEVSVDTYVRRDGKWRLKLSSDFDNTIRRYEAAYARYQQRASRESSDQ